MKKIPDRIEIITDLLGSALQSVDLGEIIEILRFSNQYNIVEKDISKEEFNQIKEIKRDKLLLANLNDLFGEPSNNFILFVYIVMAKNLYDFFKETVASLILISSLGAGLYLNLWLLILGHF